MPTSGPLIGCRCGVRQLAIMASAATPVLGRVLLVTGPEEFLRERRVARARQRALAEAPDCEFSQSTGGELTPATLGELTAPSLFSANRLVVVSQLEDAAEPVHAVLLELAAEPPQEVGLALVHSGGPKGSGLLTKLRKAVAVTEVKVAAPKAYELPRFATGEVKAVGGRMEEPAAEALVQAVGSDLRSLAAAAAQLVADFPGQTLTEDIVSRYFAGRADVKGFAVADHALFGRLDKALEELRWALDSGLSAPALTGSFATGVRGLAAFVSGNTSGVPPWKLRTLRDQARGWDERGLAMAIRAVARADAEVKGAGADAAYSLERMVMTVCGSRRAYEGNS